MIKLGDEARARALGSIRRYCEEAFDQPVGELKARLLLDYFLVEIAPSVYNGAIADSQRYFLEKVQDLDGTCYQPEFGYGAGDGGKR